MIAAEAAAPRWAPRAAPAIEIAWSLRRAAEHPALLAGEPPPGLLSRAEQALAATLGARRRADFVLGRFAVKGLILGVLARGGVIVPAEAITVARLASGAPLALLHGAGPLPLTVSISHRAGTALAALVACPGAPLGADLELVEERSRGFYEEFCSDAELARMGLEVDAVAGTATWSLKEAALKALGVGLREDPRRVSTDAAPPEDGWAPAGVALRIAGAPRRGAGFVRRAGDLLLSLVWLGDAVAAPAPAPLPASTWNCRGNAPDRNN